MVAVCPIGADACVGAPKFNDEAVVVGACVPKERTVVLAGGPNESGTVDVAVLPKVKLVEPAVVAGAKAEMSLKIHNNLKDQRQMTVQC